MTEKEMSDAQKVVILEKNVKELQEQLQNAYKRIVELSKDSKL